MSVTIDDIRKAAKKLEGHVVRSPMLAAPKLSELTGAQIHLKHENLQYTNSFKDRGAYIKLASLSRDERRRGVIAMSAGNHAQAVAYHAAALAIPATIVMPQTTPFVKVESTEKLGATVVLSGETLADAQVAAEAIIENKGLVLVHPYDDPAIIAGQGTVALEMLQDEPDLDVLIAPIGGGGLISGCAIAARALKPDIEIIGVEAALFASMSAALKGEPANCGGNTIAEGIAVKNVAERTIAIVRDLVSDIVCLDETIIERAVNACLLLQKSVVEGAGAASLGAVMLEPERYRGRKVGLVVSGGNVDPRLLSFVIYRELVRDKRIVNFRVQIPDTPGVLGRISSFIGSHGANILEVSHRRMFLDMPAKGAELELMVETRDGHHAETLLEAIRGLGFVVRLLDAPGGRESP